MKKVSAALIAMIAFVCLFNNTANAEPVELIKNGSFEEKQISGWTISKNIPGWNTSNGPGIEVQHGVAGQPQHGKQLVELDSRANTAIYQDVSTEPGKAYQLTFYFSARPGTKAGDNKLRVSWDGSVIATLDAGKGGSNTSWKAHTYAVNASQKSTRLAFQDVGISNSLGTYIDNISVKEIQKPSGEVKPGAATFSCEEKRYCKEMTSCEEAIYHLQKCDQKRLDSDKDGVPCESLCVDKKGTTPKACSPEQLNAVQDELNEAKQAKKALEQQLAQLREQLAQLQNQKASCDTGLAKCQSDLANASPAKAPFDLSGKWVGENYTCRGKFRETVQIEQTGNSIVATKITGDACVPAGNRTFEGTLNSAKITWTTGSPNRPTCCKKNGSLTIVDENTMIGNPGRVTFKRLPND